MGRRPRLALLTGLLIAVLLLAPPILALGQRLLSARTLTAMAVLVGAAPLLVAGLKPVVGRSAVLEHPLPGMVLFNAALLGWQLPVVVDATARSGLLLAGGEAALLVAATAFWWPVLKSDMSPIAKIGYLLVAGCPPTIPGILLGFSHHPLYAPLYAGGFGLTALEDQQLAGLVLFAAAKAALLTTTFVLLWRMLGASEEPPEDDDDRTLVPAMPPEAPAWLSRLDEPLPAEPSIRQPVLR